MGKTLYLITCFMLVGCGGGGYPTSNTPSLAGSGNVNSEALRVGDVVDIRLSGVPSESSGAYQEKIDETGSITMPYLNRPFKALGLTPTQLKQQIEQAYKDQKIFSTPNISIIAQPRFVNIDGEVRSPQRVQYTSDLTFLSAITACGGFTDYADRKNISILREKRIIYFNALEAQRNPTQDIPLLPGDQILVKRTMF